MKKRYLINLLPFVFSLGYFFLIMFENRIDFGFTFEVFLSNIQLYYLGCFPILFVLINILCLKKYKTYFICNTILAASFAIGYLIFGLLYYFFISSDDMTLYLAKIIPIALFTYIYIITIVGFLINLLINRKKEI